MHGDSRDRVAWTRGKDVHACVHHSAEVASDGGVRFVNGNGHIGGKCRLPAAGLMPWVPTLWRDARVAWGGALTTRIIILATRTAPMERPFGCH